MTDWADHVAGDHPEKGNGTGPHGEQRGDARVESGALSYAPLLPSWEEGDKGGHLVVNIGPQHPSTHGVLRLVVELEGERVVRLEPVIGYLHTGVEKSFEHQRYTQGITLTDRLDYLSPQFNGLAFVMAAERLLEIEPPPRAPVRPRHPLRVDAHCQPPGLAGHPCHRHRGHEHVALLLPRA